MPSQNGVIKPKEAAARCVEAVLFQNEDHPDLPVEACGSFQPAVQELLDLANEVGPGAARKALEESPDLRPLLDLYNGFRDEEEGPAKPLWGFEKPPPREWTIPNLVPEGFLSLLIADGGTGKSFLALYMALCVAVGARFLKLPVKRGRVLYVDYELDLEEQRRRLWRVAAGEGLSVSNSRLQERLFYLSPDEPVGTDSFHDQIEEVIDDHDIDVIVLDSLTLGTIGDATSQKDIVPILRRLQELPTLVAIDHVSHSTAQGSAASARAFGSVFKRNIARSSLTLAQAEGGGFLLQQEKSNFGPGETKLSYAMDWEEQSITFRRVSVTDECMEGALSDMATHDISLLAIEKLYQETQSSVSAGDVANWRAENVQDGDITEGTVRNHFTKLRKDGEIDSASGGVVPKDASED
jgi:RecA-family ATPase